MNFHKKKEKTRSSLDVRFNQLNLDYFAPEYVLVVTLANFTILTISSLR